MFKTRIVSLLLVAAVLASGCVPWGWAGSLRTESRVVETGGAESARVEIRMGAGKMRVSGGASALLNADFTFNVERWRPVVEYTVLGKEGHLVVAQPSTTGTVPANVRYEWDVRLSNEVPTDLQVSLGAGEGKLSLRSMDLKTLEIESGAGTSTLDLPSSSLTRLRVVMGVGSVDVDLTGAWNHNLSADIRGGAGTLTLRLPRATGVRVNVSGGLGRVNASGFRIQDGAYLNDAYGTSAVTLELDVAGAVGTVNLGLSG